MKTSMARSKMITARTFETAALLRVLGFGYSHAEHGRRITLAFDDPDGKGAEALRRHEREGIAVNSRAYVDSLDWAKRTIFSFKDSYYERA